MKKAKQFEEIAHSGGKVKLEAVQMPDDKTGLTFGWSSSRPVPVVLIGVYALYPGVVIEDLPILGMGVSWPVPKVPGSIPVLIGSDSEGRFGHLCPRCDGYWRSGPRPSFCPYCGVEAHHIHFLSEAQNAFVRHFCETWKSAMNLQVGEQLIIDLDEIADATMQRSERPSFYISETRQQTTWSCDECGEFHDILGRFIYCSKCSTRNDKTIFLKDINSNLRAGLKDGDAPEDCLRRATSGIDVLIKNYCEQLIQMVPLTPERKTKIEKANPTNLEYTRDALKEIFGIDINKGIKDLSFTEAKKLLLRRHVYEHNGGIVDQDYLSRSKDTSVRVGQLISEDAGAVHRLLSTLAKIASNIHNGFHLICPAKSEPIDHYKEENHEGCL